MKASFRSSKRSLRRLGTVALAGAMVFALVPAGSALADHDADHTEVCDAAPASEDFPDVSDSGTHSTNIDCASGYGWIEGFENGQFRPSEDITRGEMAAIIADYVETATGTTLATDGVDDFEDDDAGVFEGDIEKLHDNGIISGLTEDRFGPSLELTRAQMAVFVHNAIDFADNLDVDDSEPPASTTDHFEDDDTSFARVEINNLAEAGVIVGTSDTQFDPSDNVLRGETTSFAVGGATYLESQELFAPTADPTTNQTIDVTPIGDATLTVADETGDDPAADDRQYTVNSPADVEHTIALLPTANVNEADDGTVTFDDSAGTNGEADGVGNAATTAAHISVVNGTANGDTLATASPAGGEITFTIDGDGDGTVTPVVFVDADEDGALDVDDEGDTGAPTEDFGVGGDINYNPAEAAEGTINADQAITEVDKDNNFIVAGGALYEYDDNDSFFIEGQLLLDNNTADPGEEVTFATFEDELSVGDQLDGDFYQSEDELESTFLLDDLTPAQPTAPTEETDETTDTSVTLTVGNITDGNTVTIYGEEEDTATPGDDATVTTDDDVFASSATDADADATDFQIVVDGLEPETTYDFAATQSTDSEESTISNEAEDIDTAAAGAEARPTITDAQVTTDAGLQGEATTGDTYTLEFDTNMDDSTAFAGIFVLEDADGDQLQVECGTAVTDDAVMSAQCNLGPDSDSNEDRVLTITLQESTDEDSNPNVGNDDGLQYPATIETTNDEVQDDDGDVVDLAASVDVVIDDE